MDRTTAFLHNFSLNYGSTIARRLAFAMDDAFYGIPAPGYLASIRDDLAGLSRDSINTSVRRHLQKDNMWLVFITRDAEGLRDKLLSGAASTDHLPRRADSGDRC